MPSAASAPANSSADVAAAAASPSAHACAGNVPQQRLGGPHGAGSGLAEGEGLSATQASSAASSVVTAVSSPAAAAPSRAEPLTREGGAGEEAAIDHAQRRHQRSWPAPRRPGPR